MNIKKRVIFIGFFVSLLWLLWLLCLNCRAEQMSRLALAEEGARQLVASKLIPEPFSELLADDFEVEILEVEGQKYLLYVEVKGYKWLVVLETQEEPQGINWCKRNACIQIVGKVTPFKRLVAKAMNAWPGYETQWMTKD